MKYIRNDSKDPYYNLAFEEYILRNFRDGDYLLLWQNDNAAVIGKHQSVLKEISLKKAGELGVNIARRITGGGAVYHDLGNLNYSFITDFFMDQEIDYEKIIGPVVRALEKKGIRAVRTGRKDIEIEGRKFSGSAQRIIDGRLLHHGTLLFDSDLFILHEVLNSEFEKKIESKSVKSVRAKVANIKEFLREDMDIGQFRDLVLEAYFENKGFREAALTREQREEIEKLRDTKYRTWEWIYGQSPKANYRSKEKFADGQIEVEMEISEGIITECRIRSDSPAFRGAGEVENVLIGGKYTRACIMDKLKNIDLERYFGNTAYEDLLKCFL